ncbi:hypothetical protein BDR04DRAFT_729376 [Suillus decipiens]|nr:hypothetical protein BDR04DRAFT_729376 [Suillus decipiens]
MLYCALIPSVAFYPQLTAMPSIPFSFSHPTSLVLACPMFHFRRAGTTFPHPIISNYPEYADVLIFFCQALVRTFESTTTLYTFTMSLSIFECFFSIAIESSSNVGMAIHLVENCKLVNGSVTSYNPHPTNAH